MRFPVPTANKVPAITVSFWITKILTTAMGEDASDFLVHRLGNATAVITGFLMCSLAPLAHRSPTGLGRLRTWADTDGVMVLRLWY